MSRKSYVPLLSAVAALGGLLFGYDTAVISGVEIALQEHFALNATQLGSAVSCVLLGCVLGAMIGGVTADRVGRRATLLGCAVLFAGSAILSAIAPGITWFEIARIGGGIAIGATSIVSPLYIAEISPEQQRGRLVSLYQLSIVIGILLVFIVNLLIQQAGDATWNVALGWRWMMGSLVLPAIVFGSLLTFIPESPRWLLKSGRHTEAERILVRINGEDLARTRTAEIEASLIQEPISRSELLSSALRRPLFIGIVLAIVQQFCGINAVMYYGPRIFESLGAQHSAAFAEQVSVGAINLLFTFVAIQLVDRIGRRALLLTGCAVQALALLAIAVMFAIHVGGLPLLLCVLLFIAAFAATLGPVVWLVIAEIFPTKIRGRAMSVAIFVLWIADYLVSQSFPMLLQSAGAARTFALYALFSVIGLCFVWFAVPETKGRSLEAIERSWSGEIG